MFELLERAFKVLRPNSVEEGRNVWYATCSLNVFHSELSRFYSTIAEENRAEPIATDSNRSPFPTTVTKVCSLYNLTEISLKLFFQP